ncbi:MAG: hypothetical protein ACJ75R_04560 [Solirubrobacterales bacterium]
MGKTKTAASVLAILVAGALGLAACGGGDDTSSSASSTAASSTTGSTASIEAFCQKADELQALGATFQQISPNDIEGAKAAFQQAMDKINEIDDVAPPEIKSDVDTVASVFSEINDAIQGASSPADLQALGSSITAKAQQLQQALTSVKAYGRENCNS